MKDFEWENTENTMNENTDPVNENREPVAGPASEENVREDDVEDILRHAQETSRPQEAAPAQPAQDSLRTTQNAWSAAPSYQDAQPAQNRSAQGTAYSPYPNGAYRPQQNPYAANPQNMNGIQVFLLKLLFFLYFSVFFKDASDYHILSGQRVSDGFVDQLVYELVVRKTKFQL